VLRWPVAWQPGGVQIRIGHGYDVHPFSDDPHRRLVLGGVVIDGGRGLVGHSDADPVAHACIDAIVGVTGLGDIGTLFPDTDPTHAGADSCALLERAVALVREAGWIIANIDCTLVLEAPKVAPYREAIQERLTETVGAPVTVKAKRGEGLGPIGRGEGIECHAVALLTSPEGP
jgi:2-C-methyl-D-erythritol 2,4-cyclodiphosphate synthase